MRNDREQARGQENQEIISPLIRLVGSLDYSIESMWFSMMDGFDFDPCAIYLLRVNKQQYVVFTKKLAP